jgi:hypothetical protein
MAVKEIIQPATEILEDGTESLIQQPADEEGVEYADLSKPDAPEVIDAPAKPEPKPVAQPAPVVEDDIPAELKGKTPAQLAKMYRDAQSVIGRQGGELGELRKHADLLIKDRLAAAGRRPADPAAPAAPAKKKVEDADFFVKPTDAVSELIANHPELKNLKELASRYQQERIVEKALTNQSTFNTEFPDAGETLADPAFRSWIEKSNVRQRMLLAANEKYDLEAAREVFGTWKELKGAQTKAATDVSDAARKLAAQRKTTALKATAVPSGNNAAPAEKATGKKIFRRADVLLLMETDPDRYERLAPEIQLAYEEGRVK